MNRALPPGDRGYRGADSGGAPGPARVVPGAGGLVGGTAAAERREAIAPAQCARMCASLAKGGLVVLQAAIGATWRACGASAAIRAVSAREASSQQPSRQIAAEDRR